MDEVMTRSRRKKYFAEQDAEFKRKDEARQAKFAATKKRKRETDQPKAEVEQKTEIAVPLLYQPKWECPICSDVLGKDKGVIPCVLSKCIPTAHVFCMNCCQKLMADTPGGEIECPLCRRQGNTFRPLAAFVSEDADPEAHTVLDAVRTESFKVDYMNKMEAAQRVAAKMSDGHADLVSQRVAFLVEKITKAIESGALERYPDGISVNCVQVPQFDADNVRLNRLAHGRWKTTTFEGLIGQLSTMAAELQPHINAIYENTDYTATMQKQQWIWNNSRTYQRPCYLRVIVKRRQPPAQQVDSDSE